MYTEFWWENLSGISHFQDQAGDGSSPISLRQVFKKWVEWLALLLHIREVPGSNLGPETDYPD
jgi:hypothetical protein